MRSIFSIYPALYLCLFSQNYYVVFGQNLDAKVCNTQLDSGPCKAFIPMYAYDNQTDSCIQFTYGGCGGNANRFSTEEECKNYCKIENIATTVKPIAKCSLAPEKGVCLGYFKRYHFDSQSGKCEEFIYGGCGGNENNFKSIDECAESCEIESTESEDIEEDPCALDVLVGPCKALIPRFHYDKNTQKCTQFFYGGCNGNANNFQVLEDCEMKCLSKKNDSYYSDQNSICELKVDSGPCEALFHRYYYDQKLGKCVNFNYGGCQGNDNNFKTINECQQMCANQTITTTNNQISKAEVCEQKSESGTCKGYFQRYYYDSETQNCQQFIYGGCNGNTNNFETYESCQEFCKN